VINGEPSPKPKKKKRFQLQLELDDDIQKELMYHSKRTGKWPAFLVKYAWYMSKIILEKNGRTRESYDGNQE